MFSTPSSAYLSSRASNTLRVCLLDVVDPFGAGEGWLVKGGVTNKIEYIHLFVNGLLEVFRDDTLLGEFLLLYPTAQDYFSHAHHLTGFFDAVALVYYQTDSILFKLK